MDFDFDEDSNEDSDESYVWELAHSDGSSIFINYTVKESGVKYTFGPFLFFTEEQVVEQQGTLGPRNLLKSMVGHQIVAQKVALHWVLKHARTGFEPLGTDCIIIGDMLVPCSTVGAQLADASVNEDKGLSGEERESPWTSLCESFGVGTMRQVNSQMIEQMASPGTFH